MTKMMTLINALYLWIPPTLSSSVSIVSVTRYVGDIWSVCKYDWTSVVWAAEIFIPRYQLYTNKMVGVISKLCTFLWYPYTPLMQDLISSKTVLYLGKLRPKIEKRQVGQEGNRAVGSPESKAPRGFIDWYISQAIGFFNVSGFLMKLGVLR